jgi:hypothetical protein
VASVRSGFYMPQSQSLLLLIAPMRRQLTTLGFGLILALVVYGIFRVGGLLLMRFDAFPLAATDSAWTLPCGRHSGSFRQAPPAPTTGIEYSSVAS